MTGTMKVKITDEFRREAVRLVENSGRSISQIALDLGIGKSTLGKCEVVPFVRTKGTTS